MYALFMMESVSGKTGNLKKSIAGVFTIVLKAQGKPLKRLRMDHNFYTDSRSCICPALLSCDLRGWVQGHGIEFKRLTETLYETAA